MPQIVINDFSKGWCPSDDAIGGRKDGLLKMTALDLEQNGAVRMTGGSILASTAFSSPAHTMYSTNLAGTKQRYVATSDGKIYRNGLEILATTGSDRSAFGKAFNGVLIFSGATRQLDNGFTLEDIALPTPPFGITASVVSPPSIVTDFDGEYTWKFIYVNKSGASIRRSVASPASTPITLTNADLAFLVIPNPVVAYGFTQVDEIWVYRRGGALDAYYKAFVVPSSSFGAFPDFAVTDGYGDGDVLDNGEILNEFVTTVGPIDTPEDILEVVGPIGQRHIYFTSTACLITERNSPSTYDIRDIRNITQSEGEKFLFARQVGENTVVIATSHNIYTLTGTFNDLPDGFLDVYLRNLGIIERPLSRDACVYGASVIYLSSSGWQVINVNSGTSENLVSATVDRLYQYEECYGYFPTVIAPNDVNRYSCAISNDRLYVAVTTTPLLTRVDCYDFSRRYWRPLGYSGTKLLFAEEDGTLLGFSSSDLKLREIDVKFYTTLNNGGVISQQTFSLLTPFFDNGLVRNRKDTEAIKIRCNTFEGNVVVSLYTDGNMTSVAKQWTISSNILKEFNLNADGIVAKNYQFKLDGTVTNFVLNDITVTYNPRPEALTYLRHRYNNLGSSARKLIPNFPIVIDTLGNTVDVTIRDESGGLIASTTIASPWKKAFDIYPSGFTPLKGYEMLLNGAGEFEFYEELQSKFIEVFPEQLTRYQSPTFNFGSFGEKVIVVWPLCIDTLATNVNFNAYVGPALHSSTIINHGFKKSFNFVFNPPLQGVDVRFELIGGLFELWEVGKPEIVRNYPLDRAYDVISGIELSRYTKIKKIEMRIISGDNNPITCTILVQNQIVHQTQFTPRSLTDDVYEIDIPKTISGRVFDLRIGPATSPFKRISTRVQFAASGSDTELKWATL